MYLRAAKTEAADAGIETDGMADSVSKLRDDIMSLTGGKVDLMIDENTFKAPYQIFKELAEVWDDLTDVTRANILEKIGGKRNANVTAAIIQNFAQAEKALETSMNSAGSAMAENDKYMDSINGRVEKFQATWQSFSASMISSNLFKNVVSGGTALVTILDSIASKIGAIPTLIGGITAGLSAFRLANGDRTGIFDIITDPQNGNKWTGVKVFNTELSNVRDNIRETYRTLRAEGSSGIGATFKSGGWGLFNSITGASKDIREYEKLISKYKDARNEYKMMEDMKMKSGDSWNENDESALRASRNWDKAQESLLQYHEVVRNGKGLWNEYARAQLDAGESIETLSNKGFRTWVKNEGKIGQLIKERASSFGANALSMLGSTAMSMGISAAINLAIAGIGKLINMQNELRQKAHDTAVEYQQSQKSIGDYTSEVASIETSLSSGTLSIDETIAARQRLAQIQSELVSQYGSEAAGLNLVGASAEQAAAAMEHLAQVQAERFLNDPENQKGFKQAVDDMEKVQSHLVHDIKDADPAQFKQIKELTEGFDAITLGEIGKDRYDIKIKADTRDGLKQIDEFISEAEARGIDLSNVFASNGNSIYSDLLRIRKQYAEIEAASGESYDAQSDAAIKSTKDFIKIQDQINEAKSNYDEALLGTYDSDEDRAKAVQSAIKGLRDVQDVVNNTDFSGAKGVGDSFREQINSVIDGIGEEEFKADIELNIKDDSVKDGIDNIKSSFDDLSKDAPDKMKSLLSAVKQFQSDSGEIKVSDILDGQKTNAAGWERLSAAAKDYGVSVEFALQKLADAHVIQSDTTDLAYNANEQFRDLFATTNGLVESQQLLNSVYSEQSQKGTLSLKTYEALTKEHKEFAGMLETEGSSIKFNADAAQELIDAQAKENAIALQQKKIDALTRYKQNKDAIDELEKSTKRLTETEQKARDAKIARLKAENEDIEANVAKVSIQIAQLDSLTSAYSKWQVAQQTANQDTMYNDMLSAKKQIEEGLKNGMIGTDDFKTAVRMLIPDAPDPSDYKAIDSYMKKLNRYLTTDSEGNVTRTGMQNFLTDAVSKSLDGGPLMELKDGYYKVLDGIKPEDFVERLKITPSMAQAIFANLEAHGYEFDWTAEDFFHLENVEEAKNKINEVKDAFNEIDQNKDYTTEGRAQAIHDLAESEKESIKGFVDTYQAAIDEMNLYEPETQSFQDAHDKAEDLMNVIKDLPPEILMELGIDTDKLDDLLNPEGMANPIEVQADIADAKSKVEQVGETYNTTKDGIESNPITTPAPQTEPFDAGIDGVESRVGTVKDLVEGTPMKLPTPYADSFNDGITQGENRFLSMKDLVESTPIKLPTPGGQSTETSDNPEITVDSNIEPFDAGITQAETRFYSTKELIEGDPININQGEPPEIPEPQELPPIELPVDTSTAEQKIQSVRELMNLPMEMPAPNTGAAEGAIGKLEQRVAEIKKTLGSGEATNADTKITVDADTTAAKAKIVALGDTPVKVPIEADPSGIQNAVKSGVDGAIKVDVDANVAQAKQQIAQLNQMELTVNIKANLVNAQQAINGLNGGGTAQDINVAVNYNPNTGSLPESFPDISRMVNYIAQLAALPSTLPPITRMVNYVPNGPHDVNGTANASGTAHANGTAYASGNWGTAPGGTALVAELGPELIVNPDTGRWYTVGDHGAQFADIPKGAIVFNHKQTEALFKYGKVAGRGKALANGTAFAEGTALAGGPAWTIFGTNGSTSSSSGNKSKNKSTSTNKPKSNKSSKGKSNVAATATAEIEVDLRLNDKDLEEKLKDELSKMSENLEYILGQYEHEIFLIEKGAINGFTEEDVNNVVSIYKKMMDEVHSQADKARAKGLSDNSKTVRELSEKWYELRDSIKDTINDYYESLISKTGNAIKQLEFQMDRLQGRSRKLAANPQNNYDAILKQADQIVEKQREIQRLAHEGAEEMRSLGFDDVSEEVTKYKDEWAEADEAIVDAITSAYDAIDKDLENRTTLTENWLDKAITDTDFDKVIKYSDDIYNYYTQRQNAIHDEAERLRALGYSDTSEEVSKLSDLWWDYEEKRKAMAIDAWKEIIDATKEAASTISSVYDNLQKAADEYAKFGGYISLDTMESLLEMGPEYLRFLQDENGLLAINRDSIQQVIAAKYEDLAVTNALSYVERLRLAIEGKSNETLDEVLGTTNDLTGATWGLVYAKLADLNMTEDQMAIAEENIKRMQALSQNAIEGIGMTLFGDADRYADSMNDLIKYVMDMLADRLDEQIDKIKEQEDEYSKLIDKKKESLRVTKEENEYHKTIADKMKEAARLQEKIDLLALDDSRQGQAERLKLQEDLQEIQEELA